MPFYLIIILAPKVAFLNDFGDVIVRRPQPPPMEQTKEKEPSTPSLLTKDHLELAQGGPISSKKQITIKVPPPIIISADSSSTIGCSEHPKPPVVQAKSMELESIDGETVGSEEVELTEINIRGFILSEMDKMYAEYVICARPTLVDDESGNSLQAMCICERDCVDTVMARLAFYGVGNLVGSINVLALESSKFFRAPKPITPAPSNVTDRDSEKGDIESEGVDVDENGNPKGSVEAAAVAAAAEEEAELMQKKKTLIGEVASQIRVEQVVETIEESATMDFDYLALLSVASIIAAIGLATNNTVAIVASMLVSPIMGPVMACTFGSIVNKWSLVRLGAVSELVSLLICCIIGFCIGLVTMGVGTGGSWPTTEMKTRGLLDGLLVSLAIAIPSGMGVALSILGNNTSSLVGVAISASLLPPAVNCGMCLAYAVCGFKVDPEHVDDLSSYSDQNSYLDLGGISLALTIVNIGAIYLAGCLMFRLKEVAPLKDKQAFWERDTHVFRRLMQAPPSQTENSQSDQLPGKLPFDRSDLKAQVRMLKEVGRNATLRQQLDVNPEDALLGLASLPGMMPMSPMSARRPLSTRRPMSVRGPERGLPPTVPNYVRPLPKIPAEQDHEHSRGHSVLDMYRSMEVGPSANTPSYVDTSTVRTAPSHMYSKSAGYTPYSADNRYSVAQMGHIGTTGPGAGRNSVTMDMSAVKERLRKEGKFVHTVTGQRQPRR